MALFGYWGYNVDMITRDDIHHSAILEPQFTKAKGKQGLCKRCGAIKKGKECKKCTPASSKSKRI